VTADETGQGAAEQRVLLSRGSRWKPAVWRVAGPDCGPEGVCVEKSVADLAWLPRQIGRWLMRREVRALQRLRGLEGFPECLGEPTHERFRCRMLAGTPLDRERFAQEGRTTADRLLAAVAAMHARGVFHLDLRQRQNLLLDEEGGVAVVDFGAAFAPGWLGRRLWGPMLAWIDRQAVLKHLARYAPDELSPHEARSVLRAQRLRRLWPFTRHNPRGEAEAARARTGAETLAQPHAGPDAPAAEGGGESRRESDDARH